MCTLIIFKTKYKRSSSLARIFLYHVAFSLMCIYYPQQLLLKHPQLILSPQSDRRLALFRFQPSSSSLSATFAVSPSSFHRKIFSALCPPAQCYPFLTCHPYSHWVCNTHCPSNSVDSERVCREFWRSKCKVPHSFCHCLVVPRIRPRLKPHVTFRYMPIVYGERLLAPRQLKDHPLSAARFSE